MKFIFMHLTETKIKSNMYIKTQKANQKLQEISRKKTEKRV